MRIIFAIILTIILLSCNFQHEADLIVFNATIYTLDSAFSSTESMVIKDGKIVETGRLIEMEKKYIAKEKLDAQWKFIFPGFIDAHAHFAGYATGLNELNLSGAASWDEVLFHLGDFKNPDTTKWLIGRGWDQNKWKVKEFPTNEQLNHINRPVFLTRIDGHAAIANNKALELAGVKAGDKIDGGIFEVKNGRLTGVLIDNAKDFVAGKIPAPDKNEFSKALQKAQENCFAMGLTTIDDCGLDYEKVETIDSLQKLNILKMRLYVMLSDKPRNYDYLKAKGIIKTDFLNVRSFKVYGDGALGSRGACLLRDYTDKPGWKGFLLSNPAHFDSVAQVMASNGWQLCTHAIGDSSNRVLLNIYAKYLQGKNDLRWRIEHAQVINQLDFHFFGDFNIIPSTQPTHGTSDMYWAVNRLGPERLKGAYAYQQLLKENGWMPLGTDFPVEEISPFKTFFAAVERKDDHGFPAGGFQIENALGREQALKGITIWAAKANFEENEKGSLEPGKFADFVILDHDIMKVDEAGIPGLKVLRTFIAGQKVYELKGAYL